jgi:hypothetical protein
LRTRALAKLQNLIEALVRVATVTNDSLFLLYIIRHPSSANKSEVGHLTGLDETRVVCYIRCFTEFWYIVVEIENPKGVSALRLKTFLKT